MSSPQTSLLLSASRASWAVSSQHGTEWEKHKILTPAFKKSVFERDGYICQGCSWRSERFQEIHHKNDNHSDHRLENLETLCPLCHQVFHLPLAATTSGGIVIWLPEISQAELNLLCIGLFVAQQNPNSKYAQSARRLFSTLHGRSTFVEEKLGKSDPGAIGQVLLNLKPEDYAAREEFVGPLRLLPFKSRFETQVDYWASESFKDLPVDSWGTLLEKHGVTQAEGQ